MLYLLKLALRNLKRNLLRTAIAIAAIAVVVMIVVFGRGLMLGFNQSTFDLYINNQMGHVRLTEDEYLQREALLSLEYMIDGTAELSLEEMIGEIRGLAAVEEVLPRLKFGAMVSRDDELIRMLGTGIEPEVEDEFGVLEADITAGELPREGNQILLGSGLKNELGVEVGESVTLVFSDSFQSLQGRTFTVTGVRETGSPQLDDSIFYLPLATAQEMLALEDEVTEFMIFGEEAGAAGALEEEITGLLEELRAAGTYTAVRWQQADPFVELFLEADRAMDLVYVFFILLGAVVVVTTLFMIIRERKTEIGMMSALGLKGREILGIFTLEGALIGLIGSFLGAIVGGLLNYQLSRNGIEVEAFVGVVEGVDFMLEPVFYTVYSFENLLVSFLLGAVITALASLYPARSAARQNPVDALEKDV